MITAYFFRIDSTYTTVERRLVFVDDTYFVCSSICRKYVYGYSDIDRNHNHI